MYLETERLTIRRMEDRDFPDWCRYAMDPDRCRMMGTAVLTTREEAREAFDWLMLHEKRFYTLDLRAEHRGVGYILVQNFPTVGDLPELRGLTGRSLTFCVDRTYRRRGLAREALTAVLDYLFRHREVDYVNSGYFDFNAPSRELHRALGFQHLIDEAVLVGNTHPARGIETVIYRQDWLRSHPEPVWPAP